MNRLRVLFQRTIRGYAAHNDRDSVDYWKSLSFHAVAFAGLALGVLCFIPGLFIFFRAGRYMAFLVYASFFALISVIVLHRGLSVRAKASFISALFFVAGVAALVLAGPAGQRGVGFTASVVLCSLYVGFWPALGFSILGFLVGLGCGILYARGWLDIGQWQVMSLNAWVMQSLDILFVGLMLAVGAWALIQGLARSFKDLMASEARNKAALAEKEILLRELYHRTKNNMQVISSMIKLHSGQLVAAQDAQIFRDVTNKINSMALAHQMLYESESLSSVDMGPYLAKLSELLVRGHEARPDRIRLELDAAELSLPIDTAMPLGLAVSEIILNSLKHAFPGSRPGRIYAKLCLEGKILALDIGDDGLGLGPDFNLDRDGRLGLRILYLIVEKQLHGAIAVEAGPGLRYRISLPLPPVAGA